MSTKDSLIPFVGTSIFDNVANLSSSMYFLVVFIASFVSLFVNPKNSTINVAESDNINEKIAFDNAKITDTEMIFNVLRAILLFLPIIYFGKVGWNAFAHPKEYNSSNSWNSVHGIQRIFLVLYFIIVFFEIILSLIMNINIRKEQKGAVNSYKYIQWIKFGTLIFLVSFTFISFGRKLYENAYTNENHKGSKLALSFVLGMLYVVSLFTTTNYLFSKTPYMKPFFTKIIITTISFFLVFLFMMQINGQRNDIFMTRTSLQV